MAQASGSLLFWSRGLSWELLCARWWLLSQVRLLRASASCEDFRARRASHAGTRFGVRADDGNFAEVVVGQLRNNVIFGDSARVGCPSRALRSDLHCGPR
jgi:hypothetical protein